MKKNLLILTLLAVLAVGASQDVLLQTARMPWTSCGTINATTASADSALGVTERSYSLNSALTNVVIYTAGSHTNFVSVRFKLATNNWDVDIDVWAKAQGDDDLIRVCTLDVINGTQDVYGNATLHFADTINISNEAWLGDVWTVVPGAEHMAVLNMDMAGYERLVFHGYGTFDGNTTVEVREL